MNMFVSREGESEGISLGRYKDLQLQLPFFFFFFSFSKVYLT